MNRTGFTLLLFISLFAFGFDFSRHSVSIDEIEGGGPGKDDIPSLTSPKFVPADRAEFLKDDDRVLGVELDGVARAYPARILNWHEAVNDTVAKRPILVTW